MRMNRSFRGAESERGAVGVLVVILLIVLVGMAAFAFDGGLLFSRKRHLTTATDAAALTAAQWCAKTGNTSGGAQAQADSVATSNMSSAHPAELNSDGTTRVSGFQILQGQCGQTTSGKVEVAYHSDQALYFGRVLGLSSPTHVGRHAVAVWGAAGSAANLMPFMLSMGRLSNCNIPPGPPIGTKCAFWWNNKDISNAQWGMINLDQWNVSGTTNCTSAGTSSTEKWMNGGTLTLSLNWPSPTYVCIDTGVSQSIFGTSGNPTCTGGNSDPMICQVGKQRDFPVNDPCNVSQTSPRQGQIDKNGNLVRPSTNLPAHCDTSIPTGTPDKYDIVGFTSLLITGLYRGNSAAAADPVNGCGAVPGFTSDPNGECLVTTWEGFQFGGGTGGGGGGNFGVTAINLVGG
jgi:Flp pilus assembly protein TadG